MRTLKTILASLFLLAILILPVSALTASIGNSRMVLHADVGETVERYILVRNVNTEAVNINMTVSGNLTKTTKLRESHFTLQPNEEKNAYFTIKSTQPGMTQTTIQVAFSSADAPGGVGLASTVILIAGGNSTYDGEDDTEIIPTNNTFPFIPGIGGSNSPISLPPAVILTISTVLLVLIFGALLLYYKKIKARKGARRSHG